MTSTEFIKEISLGSHTLCLIMHNQTPLVERDGQFFNHIWLLSQHLPILSDPTYIRQFAEISNFLWKGIQFQFIKNVVDYQNFYIEQVELEKRCATDVFQCRLTDYKIFDVSVMHEPLLENGQLLYYVYNISTGLPYRVSCPFPYEAASTLVHYQILPIKTEASLS